MTKLQKVLLTLGVFVLLCVTGGAIFWGLAAQGSPPALCAYKKMQARYTDVPVRLERWAKQNVFAQPVSLSDVSLSAISVGTQYQFTREDFPATRFGFFNPKFTAVGVLVADGESLSDTGSASVSSATFGEMLTVAFVVKRQGMAEFGIGKEASYLHHISANVALLCLPGRD